ncbi:hypothetical protein HDE_11301 [Halotydeus destructor]|nr:hypothetical protein HDE_11301 [Halotydeus destructor]
MYPSQLASILSLLLISFLAVSTGQGQGTGKRACQRLRKRSDNCLRNALMYNKPNYPNTLAQMDEMVCNSLLADLKCIGDYRACVKPFPKTLFSLVLRSVRQSMKSNMCGSEAIKRQFVDAFRCLDNKANTGRFFLIYDKVSALLEHVGTTSSADDLMGPLCCVYHHYTTYAPVVVQAACPGQDTTKMANVTLNLLKSMFDDTIDLGCGPMSSLAACEARIPGLTGQMRTVFDGVNSSYKTSPLIPLLNILDKLDSDLTLQAPSDGN